MLSKSQINEFYDVLVYSNCKINNKYFIVKNCVQISYNTICRALTKSKGSKFDISKDKKNLLNFITEKIISYNINDVFDEWHENLCEEIWKKYNLEIGYSQHIINLTLKYICCLYVNNGLTLTNINFDDCHFDITMPNIRELEKNKLTIKLKSLLDINTYDYYKSIQERIKEISTKPTLIEFECDIWNNK